jgi:hypothetical protein
LTDSEESSFSEEKEAKRLPAYQPSDTASAA